MFIDLGYSVALTEEQFQAEMAKRRASMKSRNDYDIGCPLCWAPPVAKPKPRARRSSREAISSDPFGASSSVSRGARHACRRPSSRSSLQQLARRRADPLCLFVRSATRTRLRRLDAERRRFVHAVLRLHEHELAAGVRHSGRPGQHFEPGNPDQGQPTHFYPRRNPFLFTFKVPKDFGNKELIWTLTANGETRKAYASLKSDYEIDQQVISTEVGGDNGSLADDLRDNIPPDLKVEGSKTRTVKVGQPLSLAVDRRRSRQPAGRAATGSRSPGA